MLRSAIQRPIAISMLFLALVLIGLLSFNRLPVDLLPSITYPRLTVVTVYEDIPAEDLERLVTQPIEEMVTALPKVRNVTSRTREGVSMITLEYEWGTQMEFANLRLREAIDRVAFRRDFPEAADRPVIIRWDPTSRPISIMTLRGSDRMEALTDFAREVVKPGLEQVDGVSQAEVVGGADREILVQPDPEKLALYGIAIEDMRDALARSNVNFPGGQIRQGPLHLSLRIAGEFEDLDQIAGTEIARPGRSSIRVSDVARVLDTVKEPEGYTLLGDEVAVALLIYKEPDANTLLVSESIDEALAALQRDWGNFAYDFVYRDAEYVRASFTGLVQSLIIGALLAFFVLFLFLRDARSPLVVGVSIPVSITITAGLLYFGKVKLNLMSLGGLSLAAGMLVDNAIVVLENINRHIKERARGGMTGGADDRSAGGPGAGPTSPSLPGPRPDPIVAGCAEVGTREVARAVAAATFTTIAVFFPVVYVPGIAGAFFRDQALTVTFSLLVSVAAALLLQPMLAARVLEAGDREPRGLFRVFHDAFERVHHGYHGVLVRSLHHPRIMLGMLVIGLAACAVVGLTLDQSFMPERSSGDVRLELELPAGTPLEETKTFVADLAGWIAKHDRVAHVFSQVGRTEHTLAAMQHYAAPHTARVRIILEPGRGAHAVGLRLQDAIARRLNEIPEAQYAFREEGIGLGELLATGESPFSLGVVADDPMQAVAAAEDLASELRHVPGLTDIQVDRVLGSSNLVVSLDRETIHRHGLSPDRVARELRNRITGVEATTFNEIEQRIDISIRLPREDRLDLGSALNASIQLPGGETVPLRSFLHITEERPVRELVRRNQRRMVTINGDVHDRSIGDVWKDALALTRRIPSDGGLMFLEGGEEEAIHQSFRDLGWAMVLAVLLVYMILAAQFESFLDPFLIAAVLPIGVAGAILALAISSQSINILSIIGLLALLGIAVNDAIVKVDTIRRLRAEGMNDHAAVLEGSRLRFRPILMTSVTTVLAMVPMAIGLGSGEQLQRPLALTIIGGLSLTTLLTLFYTPLLYELAHRIRPDRAVEHDQLPGEPAPAEWLASVEGEGRSRPEATS